MHRVECEHVGKLVAALGVVCHDDGRHGCAGAQVFDHQPYGRPLRPFSLQETARSTCGVGLTVSGQCFKGAVDPRDGKARFSGHAEGRHRQRSEQVAQHLVPRPPRLVGTAELLRQRVELLAPHLSGRCRCGGLRRARTPPRLLLLGRRSQRNSVASLCPLHRRCPGTAPRPRRPRRRAPSPAGAAPIGATSATGSAPAAASSAAREGGRSASGAGRSWERRGGGWSANGAGGRFEGHGGGGTDQRAGGELDWRVRQTPVLRRPLLTHVNGPWRRACIHSAPRRRQCRLRRRVRQPRLDRPN
mmetsp:Transcript_6583/g.19709  ORF Transcript_6583/g.19709 Transcript_6583/m.19709 type:complete len:302 (-) Transcript_6583:1386-2291(-)